MKSIEWLAGLFEGEGCFQVQRCGRVNPAIGLKISSTDKDVAECVAEHFAVKMPGPRHDGNPKHKPIYCVSRAGLEAVEIALNMFPHLHSRRRRRFEGMLSEWEHNHTPLKSSSWISRRSKVSPRKEV